MFQLDSVLDSCFKNCFKNFCNSKIYKKKEKEKEKEKNWFWFAGGGGMLLPPVACGVRGLLCFALFLCWAEREPG